mmetsp:Transcript_54124/g.174871  ORF Transcript_54124/g.174871 Transcript_54124/m.174871 type:complete len:269 (+) Transcript_54124:84-890(+)
MAPHMERSTLMWNASRDSNSEFQVAIKVTFLTVSKVQSPGSSLRTSSCPSSSGSSSPTADARCGAEPISFLLPRAAHAKDWFDYSSEDGRFDEGASTSAHSQQVGEERAEDEVADERAVHEEQGQAQKDDRHEAEPQCTERQELPAHQVTRRPCTDVHKLRNRPGPRRRNKAKAWDEAHAGAAAPPLQPAEAPHGGRQSGGPPGARAPSAAAPTTMPSAGTTAGYVPVWWVDATNHLQYAMCPVLSGQSPWQQYVQGGVGSLSQYLQR